MNATSAGPLLAGTPGALVAPRRDFETRRVAVGGQRVAVDVYEHDGPTVLLLHGIPGWRGVWRNVASLLQECRIVAPDLLGFGESSDPRGDFHAAGQAEMIVDLIRCLAAGPVHVVGFDFGGPIAVLTRRQAPELVASLTLAATNILVDTPIPGPLRLVCPPVVGDVFARATFSRMGLFAMWRQAVKRRGVYPFSQFREILRFPNGVRSTRRVFQSSLRDLPGLYAPVEAALAHIRVPCQVVWGDCDPFFPVPVGERSAARIPGARLVRLSGCGHFLPGEDPAGLARAIRELAVPR